MLSMMEAESVDSRRTVVVSGVPSVLPVDRMVDKLTIHFQRRGRSDGGDVEVVTYPTYMDGVAFVTFDRAEGRERCELLADAERVVKKEEQIMMDAEFTQDYSLTVFPFSRDVFLYVPHATVDLSVFGSDQASLIRSLRSAHRSIRFQSLGQERKAIIEGPFSAIQALRNDLVRRASCFKPSFLTTSVQRGETSHRSRVTTHHDGSVRSRSPKADQELASSSSISVSQQRTGEDQCSFSKAKSQNTSLRQKVSDEGLGGASCCDTDNDEKALGRLQMSAKYGTEWPSTGLREVEGEETKPVLVSSLSSLDPRPPEETSAKQKRRKSFSEKHSRSERISAGNHLISRYRIMDYVKDTSSSLATTKVPQSERRLESTVRKSNIGGSEELPPEDSQDIWVDLYTFRYTEKFCRKNLDTCLEDVHMTMEGDEEAGLMRISLKEKQPSKARSHVLAFALKYLKTMMEIWQSRLRVREIFYSKAEWPNKQTLIQICDGANLLCDDVLYILEDSCIKVIGPSESSHLFCKRVEDKMTRPRSFLVSS